jgi:hypothetical protein
VKGTSRQSKFHQGAELRRTTINVPGVTVVRSRRRAGLGGGARKLRTPPRKRTCGFCGHLASGDRLPTAATSVRPQGRGWSEAHASLRRASDGHQRYRGRARRAASTGVGGRTFMSARNRRRLATPPGGLAHEGGHGALRRHGLARPAAIEGRDTAGPPTAVWDELERTPLITHENPAAGAMRVATLTREHATALERWLVDATGGADAPASLGAAPFGA